MRWRKVVGLQFHSLEKREHRRGRDQIRRYSKWRGDRYRWMRIVNIMDVWEKRRGHVEGQGEGDGGKHEEREGNGATGTVNVGTGAANINIGSTAASAIVIGNAAGSITLKSALTLANGGELGDVITSTVVTGTLPAGGSGTTINSIALTTGTWILTGNGLFTATTDAFLSISATSGSRDSNGSQSGGSTINFSINVTRVYAGTAITLYLVAYSVGGGIGSVRFTAYRIG